MKSSQNSYFAAIFFVLCFMCNQSFAQCLQVNNDALEVGGAAVNWPLQDLVHVRAFNGLYCGFKNPAVRLDETGQIYFGQFSLAGQTMPTQNCMLASTGDVILRSSPTANNLILTCQKPGGIAWPHVGGGRIRFLTDNGIENEVMRLTSDGSISLGAPSGNPAFYTPADPLGPIHIRDKMILSGGDWASIKYNSYSSVALFLTNGGVWHEKRIGEGISGSIGFAPNTNPPDILAKELREAMYIAVNEYGASKGDGGSDVQNPSHMSISHSKWEFYAPEKFPDGSANPDRMLFRIQCQIPDPVNIGQNLFDPYVFTPHLLCVGSDGIFNSSAWMGTGKFDLSTTTHTENLMLAVNGLILCKELVVKITQPPWPDYVFQDNYKLMPIADLEKSVKENKHLPGLPSAKEIETGGVNVVDLEAKLVKKVEELTLYVIELNKENKELRKEINSIK